MRVTKETQERTRRDLLEAARELFRDQGFQATTTRALAARAGIGTGTLFNYFAGKELLGAAVLAEALEAAEEEHDRTRREGEPLEETLFAFVSLQLRHLRPYRAWARDVLALTAQAARGGGASELDLRARHLERVERWMVAAGGERDVALDLHLYWTLVLGVLDFWSRDETPNQEATLALLDRSMGLFARGLREDREG